jgi:hypothetical protein
MFLAASINSDSLKLGSSEKQGQVLPQRSFEFSQKTKPSPVIL